MKKLLTLVLTLVIALSCVAGLTACGGGAKYVANAVEGVEVEEYGFAIGKNSSKKTEILAAMNKIIAETDIQKAVDYYTAIYKDETPTVSIELPNLADNTAGTLNVYTESGFAPYEFVNDDNEVIGVDMYLMSLVCEELNMQIKITDMLFDGICGKVATEDNAIGAAGMTVTDERKEKVDFSATYFSTVQSIISTEDEAFSTLEDLKGKKIGVQKGTTGWKMVSDAIESGVLKDTGAEVVPYDNGPMAYTALKSGRCDVVVIDELPAKKLVG